MRTATLPLLAAVALLAFGCAEETPVLEVVPRVPDDPTLFDDIDGLTFRLEQGGATQVLARFPGDATTLELPAVPFGEGYRYVLEGWLGESLVARGAPATWTWARPMRWRRRACTSAGSPCSSRPGPPPRLQRADPDRARRGRAGPGRRDHRALRRHDGSVLQPRAPLRWLPGERGAPGGAAQRRRAPGRGRRADGAPAQTACAYRRTLDSVVELRTQSSLLRLDLDGHTLTSLGNGKALLVGNRLAAGSFVKDASAAWLYDDAAGTWSQVASLGTARSDHAAVATSTTDAGQMVMIVGGRASDGTLLDTIEIFNPTRGQFTEYPRAWGRRARARRPPTSRARRRWCSRAAAAATGSPSTP